MSDGGGSDGARAATDVAFVLRPDWLRDTVWVTAVHNYLHAFAPDEGCILWLEVDPAALTIGEAVDILRPVLAQFDDRPFPELSLSDDPHEAPPRARTVVLPTSGDALLRWTPDEFRACRAGELP